MPLQEIFINRSPNETRMAILQDKELLEIVVELQCKKGYAGNIYMGKVVRVLPGMQAAFVEIGLERAAFIHLSDILDVRFEEVPLKVKPQKSGKTIQSFLQEGQSIPVQVLKDPIGTKGARLTAQLSIPSRYLVFMPGLTHIGLSQKISEESERERLREIVESAVKDKGGCIVRTAANGIEDSVLKGDLKYLLKTYSQITQKIRKAKNGDLLFENLPLEVRALRDFAKEDTKRILYDDDIAYHQAQGFAKRFMPKMAKKLELYKSTRPIFDQYKIEDELENALSRKVPLKSGGYVIIDQTEALTTVDVNTGAFVGHHNVEQTIYRTNIEATHAIARQVRLRNIGGIIIIDFIDMNNEKHQSQVVEVLKEHLRLDPARFTVSEVSALGLVEMTRKRTKESLEHLLCDTCPACDGRGSVKSEETVCNEVLREVMRVNHDGATGFLLIASKGVVERFLDEHLASLDRLQDILGKTIELQTEDNYTPGQYDVLAK